MEEEINGTSEVTKEGGNWSKEFKRELTWSIIYINLGAGSPNS